MDMENLKQPLIVTFKLKGLVKNVDMKQLLQKGKKHKKCSFQSEEEEEE